MRVTTNSPIKPFQNALSAIQESKYKNEIRNETGKKNIGLSDNPKDVVNSKVYAEMIERNKSYINNIEESYSEMQMANDVMDSIQEKMASVRETAILSTSPGNTNNLATLAKVIKNQLEDIVNNANSSHNGKFLFAGTKTTINSLTETDGTTHQLPFEIITEAPSATNPSGLRVRFNGNFNPREINRDSLNTEQINTTADKMFGTGGIAALTEIINVYNTMAYNADGTARTMNDYYTIPDTNKMNDFIKNTGNQHEVMLNANAVNGAKTNRINAVKEQLTEENVRIKNMLSLAQDTNYSETLMALMKDQTALDYALQIGSRINSKTLFDFLG